LSPSEAAGEAPRPHPARARGRHGHRRRAAAHHGHRPGARDREAARTHSACRSCDIDVIELNEAFAAQGLAVLRQLGLPMTTRM
jgi:acetyl-CoA acetyltransferase